MTMFDQILPRVAEVLRDHTNALPTIGSILVNRDLNGRVRLVIGEPARTDATAKQALDAIAGELQGQLGPHAYPAENAVLFEVDLDSVCAGAPTFPLEGFEGVQVIDRLATEGNWASIASEATGAPRIVFFSIKGRVGRSTALAASAWALAQTGQRVLVLDLDLESPDLSSALLPEERRPTYGIADWLVEDLVDNGDAVFEDLMATSTLSHDGEIDVVPTHGRDPGEYVAKLGRVWMPKMRSDGTREVWSRRLSRLIDALEARWRPDVILLDSRAGIDEVASICVTDLGAKLVLLFAIDGEQTWSGYRILFQHWRQSDVVRDIRERLQMGGAMIPETDAIEYFAGLRERGYDLFVEELYDEIPPGEVAGERWNFDASDGGAPHYPWAVRWHRGFAAPRSLHVRLNPSTRGRWRPFSVRSSRTWRLSPARKGKEMGDVTKIRKALIEALPIETANHGEAPDAAALYIPPFHIKALRLVRCSK